MNDVSLTGCFLNDIQSPEKPSKTSSIVHVLNENSRDSIFFNVSFLDFCRERIGSLVSMFFFYLSAGHHNGHHASSGQQIRRIVTYNQSHFSYSFEQHWQQRQLAPPAEPSGSDEISHLSREPGTLAINEQLFFFSSSFPLSFILYFFTRMAASDRLLVSRIDCGLFLAFLLACLALLCNC